jgi:kynurenine formamidase
MCADRVLVGEGPNNWGRWGKEDERGALNLLTPEVVLAATRVCKTGVVYNLGLPIQMSGSGPLFAYRGTPQRLTLTNQADPGAFVDYGAPTDVGANEDVLVFASHTLTHMDALSHVFAEGTFYNGFQSDAARTNQGVPNCGIDNVEIRSGDILLVRTGFLEYWHSIGEPEVALQAGLGFDAVDFIRDHDISVVGSDNSAIEPVPFDRGIFLGVHIELLIKLGVHLLEHVNLVGLSADQVTECLFVVAPLPVTGASGSPINPIAIG